tara:strand:+ start:1474 stop:1665 length:192 start_codon:yes stop_codon:yes gene_type:complete
MNKQIIYKIVDENNNYVKDTAGNDVYGLTKPWAEFLIETYNRHYNMKVRIKVEKRESESSRAL